MNANESLCITFITFSCILMFYHIAQIISFKLHPRISIWSISYFIFIIIGATNQFLIAHLPKNRGISDQQCFNVGKIESISLALAQFCFGMVLFSRAFMIFKSNSKWIDRINISWWIFLTSSIIIDSLICAFYHHSRREKGDHFGCYMNKTKEAKFTLILLMVHTILMSALYLAIFIVPLWYLWAINISGNYDSSKRKRTLVKSVFWVGVYAFGVILSAVFILTNMFSAHLASTPGYFCANLCLVNQFKRLEFLRCDEIEKDEEQNL